MALNFRADPDVSLAPGGVRRPPRARYLPIAEHGLIGDLHTAALVGSDGTIDWYCCPRFDSPSVFASILDADRGGLFRIAPDREGWSQQAALLARHQRAHHPLPVARRSRRDAGLHAPAAYRRDGASPPHDPPGPRRAWADALPRRCRPALRLRARRPRGRAHPARRGLPLTPSLTLGLSTRCPLELVDGRDIRARFELRAGETATFVLDQVEGGDAAGALLRGRRRRRVRRHHGVLAGLAASLPLQRPLAGDGAPLGARR